MSPHRPQPRSRGPRKPTGIEWLGGTVAMPAYVTDEGEPYRPEALFWMGAEGTILGSTMARPGELLSLANESLRSAIEQPMSGMPHTPTRVRVASADLADALRAGHPRLEVVCAPTPELDEMLALMLEMMAERGAAEQSYFSPGITQEAMASFFKAAAALFRAKPWNLVPNDESLFSVTIEELGLCELAMSVIGQMGKSFGFLLFSDLDDFEDYLDAADVIELGEQPEMPPHFALNFERGAELAPKLRKEISKHRWEVAGANAYPWLVAVDAELVARPPTGDEVTMAEAIALALTGVMAENEKALRKAWGGGEPVSRTVSVSTYERELEVTLCAPYMQAPGEFDPSPEMILAAVTELRRIDDDFAQKRRLALSGTKTPTTAKKPTTTKKPTTVKKPTTAKKAEGLPAEEAISNPLIFLIGPPGAGKSALGCRACTELGIEFLDFSATRAAASLDDSLSDLDRLERLVSDRAADVIELPWRLQQDRQALRLARKSGTTLLLWAHPEEMQERSGHADPLFTPVPRLTTRGGFGRNGTGCREFRRLDRACEDVLILVGLPFDEAAGIVRDCIEEIREESNTSPAKRERLESWIEDWRQDHHASPRVSRVIVDAMAAYLAHLRANGSSPRALSTVRADLNAAGHLVLMYDAPKGNGALRHFNNPPWEFEFSRKFNDSPALVTRYRRSLEGFARFLKKHDPG